MRRRFSQVDVFTARPLLGNPVAVVHEPAGLTTEQMQAFTDWTNLSEATFLLPPTDPAADYAVRIFCPGRELPFAGHPTLGTCHAWLAAGGLPRGERIVQECGIGLVEIARQGSGLAFLAPPRRRTGPLAPDAATRIAAGLGIGPDEILAHEWCDNGPGWQAVLLRDAQAVLEVRPDAGTLLGLDVGVVGMHPNGGPADIEVRAFFTTGRTVAEDPVTGSLNAAIGQWLLDAGHLVAPYVARQGTAVGRDGRVRISQDAQGVWVGGDCVTVIDGHVDL